MAGILNRTGAILTEEHKRKIGEAQLGEKNHMFGKRGTLSPLFGKKASSETKEKISASKKGKKNPNLGLIHRKKIICLNNNKIYDSAKIVAKELAISHSGVCMAARG